MEIISPSTRRRDYEQKKSLYMGAGVVEYWIVDPEYQSIMVVRRGEDDRVQRERVEWRPPRVEAALTVAIDEVFGDTRAR